MYPNAIPRFGDLSRMSFSPNMPGISTGNIMIDMMLSSMLGNRNFSAIPGQGQGVYDAYLTQQRSRQFIQSLQHGFGNSLLFSKFGGMQMGAAGQAAAMFFGQPDGIMNSNFMRAMNGGNPVKQMMALTAGMTGQTMNMAYGSPANATFSQIKAAYDGQNAAMFTSKVYQQADYDKVRANSSMSLAKDLSNSTAGLGLFGDVITKNKDGSRSFDFDKFERNAKKYADLAEKSGDPAVIAAYNKAFDKTEGLQDLKRKINTKVLDKVDFTATRGFESQDLTSALLMGKDLGMVFSKNRFVKNAEPNEKDIYETEKAATKNVAILMDAMRDISGTSSTTGLMSEINQFLGKGQLNLGNAAQTKDVEKLLREFKGAARAAGISIETVMGIQAASQELARMYPQLGNRSGTALAASNTKAIQSTSALTSALGPDWTRAQGGQAKLLENISASNIMATDEIFVKEAAGMTAMIDSSSLSDTDKSNLMSYLQTALNNGDLADPRKQIPVVQHLASKLGVSLDALKNTATSHSAQRVGFDIWEQDRIKGVRDWDIEGSAGALTAQDFSQLAEVHQLDLTKFNKALASGITWDQAAVAAGLTQHPAFKGVEDNEIYKLRYTQHIAKTHPDSSYAKELASLKASGNAYARDAAAFAERGGALKANFSSVIMQEILGGNLEKGLESLTGVFTNSDKRVRGDAILRATRGVADEGTTLAIKEAMLERAGGLNVSSTDELRKNLKIMGVSDSEMDMRIKQHEALRNSEEWENLDKVGDLSMQDILNASKSDADWARSRAAASGYDKGMVNRAASFLNASGMATFAGKYGRRSWNQAKQGMAINAGVDSAAILAAEEQITDINNKTDVNFEKQISDLAKSNDPEARALLEAINTLDPSLIKHDNTGVVDTAGILKKAFSASDPNKPDSPAAKAAKEKLQKNAVLASAHASIDNVVQSANGAGDSAEKLMIDEFSKLSKQIGDSSGNIANAIQQLVTMLGSFASVS